LRGGLPITKVPLPESWGICGIIMKLYVQRATSAGDGGAKVRYGRLGSGTCYSKGTEAANSDQ
jgi:hypothetical protein